MIVVRAWPDRPPPNRARVEDQWPRVRVDEYDYRRLADLGEDVISLDWDTAVGRDELRQFIQLARAAPEVPLVAPCLMYEGLPLATWNCRRWERGTKAMRFVEEGEPTCHLFGFGMVYLPARWIKQYVADNPGRILDDTSFSAWFHRVTCRETVITWNIRPVHLHYTVPVDGRV
jgi:hypothetical protein